MWTRRPRAGRRSDVVGVGRERSAYKLDAFSGRITVMPGFTNDPQVIKAALAAKAEG